MNPNIQTLPYEHRLLKGAAVAMLAVVSVGCGPSAENPNLLIGNQQTAELPPAVEPPEVEYLGQDGLPVDLDRYWLLPNKKVLEAIARYNRTKRK